MLFLFIPCGVERFPNNLAARVKVLELYHKLGSITATRRAFQREMNTRDAPSRNLIFCLAEQFGQKGSVVKRAYHRECLVRTAAIVSRLRQALKMSRKRSTRRLAQQTGIARTTVQRMQQHELGLFPHKVRCRK